MSDRKLLKTAAKAAGYRLDGLASKHIVQGVGPDDMLLLNDRGGHSVWNPLTDDGDALRLAVNLALEIRPSVGMVTVAGSGVWEEVPTADYSYSREEATRRAIVRAAAALA